MTLPCDDDSYWRYPVYCVLNQVEVEWGVAPDDVAIIFTFVIFCLAELFLFWTYPQYCMIFYDYATVTVKNAPAAVVSDKNDHDEGKGFGNGGDDHDYDHHEIFRLGDYATGSTGGNLRRKLLD